MHRRCIWSEYACCYIGLIWTQSVLYLGLVISFNHVSDDDELALLSCRGECPWN